MKILFTACLLGFCSLLFAAEPEPSTESTPVCTAETLNPVSQAQAAGMMYEVARINDVFDLCSRKRATDHSEDYLYTWGYAAKLQRMLNTERFEFCAHDQARLQTATALHFDELQGDTRIELLDDYLEDITRDYHSIPSESYYPLLKDKTPNAIAALLNTQQEECEGNLRCIRQIEGRLAGLNQFRRGGFANTATNGHGVYFANDPLSFISHKKSDDDIGLVCDLSSTKLKITDLAYQQTESALEQWMIRIPSPDQANQIPEAIRKQALTARALYPYYNLPAYEMAGHKRILRLHGAADIYLDKCSIEYRASCKLISVKNLNSCRTIKQVHTAIDTLLNNPESISNAFEKDQYVQLGYYLIQQGGFRNTEHLLEALDERRKLRCKKNKVRNPDTF